MLNIPIIYNNNMCLIIKKPDREIKDLHKQTGIEQSRISEIVHYKITKFTIDKILAWPNILAQHSPKIREHLLFLEEAISMPVFSAKKTRKLKSDIRKVHYA
jgi:hypothetical protein